MDFLNLSLYQHPSGKRFDPGKVVERVKAAFPEVSVLPGDQLAEDARRAEARVAAELRENPDGPARRVVDSLRRKAAAYGPAYAFEVPLPGGGIIKGLARGVNVQFLFDDSLPADIRGRLIDFLKSLGVGRLASSAPDGQEQVLCELNGPSDCVRQPEQVTG